MLDRDPCLILDNNAITRKSRNSTYIFAPLEQVDGEAWSTLLALIRHRAIGSIAQEKDTYVSGENDCGDPTSTRSNGTIHRAQAFLQTWRSRCGRRACTNIIRQSSPELTSIHVKTIDQLGVEQRNEI